MTIRCVSFLMILSLCACSGDKQADVQGRAIPRPGGVLEGTVIFLDRPFPPGSKLTAVLDRAVSSADGPATWEPLDRMEMPLSAPPLSFTLHYDPDRVKGRRYRVRVWGEDSLGTLLLATQAQPVELPVTVPPAMMLRYVGKP